ncbi:zinc-binding alcohol dehydrogenase family protein [Furfurilactobacillus milii]|uniref:Zinc-type alcohol dehydrogenase-like protein n=1 Tax=Furfurilactobacillus milii TaxID=2888272 RepID=A0A6N9HZN9_9LACO|nr:zinc-binding alcohol dehydrogenase family protein [Furfurilactobacillus milii]MYV16038.1 zinc-binding alcohol dehydrogenase family protein [Furfurilactobacillus milii]
MNAIGFKKHLPIEDQESLIDFTEPMPISKGHDLLVHVHATSVNPVDIGVRRGGHAILETPKVIGWDAEGIVESVGEKVTLFKPGDRVFYAGSFKRPGSDSEYQLVDERIVGNAPKAFNDAQVAAMPLTSLTAWEALFEQLQIDYMDRDTNSQHTILIINGAGGVGSIATQLAHFAGLKVIATASNEESNQWVLDHGADFVVDHSTDLVKQLHNLEFQDVDYILGLSHLDEHWNEIASLIKPHGRIASITENRRPIDLKKLTKKRATFAWEWMYSKSYFQTEDMSSQHEILNAIANLMDQGIVKSTLTKTLSPINAANLREAHRIIETNHNIGKIVVTND